MLDAVGMNEINKIFAVIDAMGVHREHVVIPLGTGKGRVRRMPSGKLEIIVDAETPIDEWLTGLPDLIRAAQSACSIVPSSVMSGASPAMARGYPSTGLRHISRAGRRSSWRRRRCTRPRLCTTGSRIP